MPVPRPVTSRTSPAAVATAATIGRPPGCIGGIASRTSPTTWRREKPDGPLAVAAGSGPAGVGSVMSAASLLQTGVAREGRVAAATVRERIGTGSGGRRC